MREVDFIGPKWCQPVHFKAEHLIQIVLCGQRQIQDLAQTEFVAQAHRDRSPPTLRLLQQLAQTLVVVGSIGIDAAQHALIVGGPLQHHRLLTSQDQHRAAALAAAGLSQTTRHQAAQLPEPPAEERGNTASEQSQHIPHDLELDLGAGRPLQTGTRHA